MSRNTGLTRTQAHNMAQKGYPIAYVQDIMRARPHIPGVQYMATPIEAERLLLISFKTSEEAAAWAAENPAAEPLAI